MYHVPLAFQCVYGGNDGGESGDEKEGSEISGEGEIEEIAWPLVRR